MQCNFAQKPGGELAGLIFSIENTRKTKEPLQMAE
jgi:hypothetical protein